MTGFALFRPTIRHGKILFPDVNAGPIQEWYYMTRRNPDFERYE